MGVPQQKEHLDFVREINNKQNNIMKEEEILDYKQNGMVNFH
jgi:hypothetical protein